MVVRDVSEGFGVISGSVVRNLEDELVIDAAFDMTSMDVSYSIDVECASCVIVMKCEDKKTVVVVL